MCKNTKTSGIRETDLNKNKKETFLLNIDTRPLAYRLLVLVHLRGRELPFRQLNKIHRIHRVFRDRFHTPELGTVWSRGRFQRESMSRQNSWFISFTLSFFQIQHFILTFKSD